MKFVRKEFVRNCKGKNEAGMNKHPRAAGRRSLDGERRVISDLRWRPLVDAPFNVYPNEKDA